MTAGHGPDADDDVREAAAVAVERAIAVVAAALVNGRARS
jgi:hypothetical protein